MAITLPPAAVINRAADDLARRAPSPAVARAVRKAEYYMLGGIELREAGSGVLMPSGTRGGTVHYYSFDHGCSCEAAQAGRGCWHAAVVEIMQECSLYRVDLAPTVAPSAPTLADRMAVALAEVNELFA